MTFKELMFNFLYERKVEPPRIVRVRCDRNDSHTLFILAQFELSRWRCYRIVVNLKYVD